MLYFPMDFGELNMDGLIDEGAVSNAISETRIRNIRLMIAQTQLIEGPPPRLQIWLPMDKWKHLLQQ